MKFFTDIKWALFWLGYLVCSLASQYASLDFLAHILGVFNIACCIFYSHFENVFEQYTFYYSGDYFIEVEEGPEIPQATKDLIDKISRGPEEEGAAK